MNENDDAEYLDHARMWHGFTRFTTWGVIFVVLILVTMAATLV